MLTFRLFDMPVTVRGSFLLIAALIGLVGVGGVAETVAWIVIVFASILIHELGHAVTARMFGSEVAIELNGLGGLTRWSAPHGELTPGRRASIAAAGSATGLLFGGLVWLVASRFGPYPTLAGFVLDSLIYVNVFWGLLNWLPIRPLDGGHLLESLLEKIAPNRAEVIARIVFTATAAAALAISLSMRLFFIAVLAGWLLLSELAIGREQAPRPQGLPVFSYDDDPHDQGSSDDGIDVVELVDPEDGGDPPDRRPDRY